MSKLLAILATLKAILIAAGVAVARGDILPVILISILLNLAQLGSKPIGQAVLRDSVASPPSQDRNRWFRMHATKSLVMVVERPLKPRLLRMNEGIHAERTASEPQDRVTELVEQQTAISEVLRAIASSPHDLRPIFDTILDSATRLCRANIGSLRLSEEGGLRLVAVRGDPFLVSQVWSSIPVFAEDGSHLSRMATSRLPTHIPDLTAVKGDLRDDYWKVVVKAGFRTGLVVPLLKDNEIVG
jgi:hypothetical protein